MKNLPVEIENKIWDMYYSHIYYKNVILELKNRIALCDQIVNSDQKSLRYNKTMGNSPLISFLKLCSISFLPSYTGERDKDDFKYRLFKASFYNEDNPKKWQVFNTRYSKTILY